MIIEPSCDGLSTQQQQLPAVSVESLTRVQLRELIPKLVTFSTGESCDVSEKPKWWTDDVPWRENGDYKLSSQDEVGVEVLRDLIRGCYRYLGQEDLLMCPDLPNEMKPLPSSPQLAESALKAAEPSSSVEGKATNPPIESKHHNTDHYHTEYIASDKRSEINESLKGTGIPETVGLSNDGKNEDFDFLDLIDEEERERSLRENEDSSNPDIDPDITKTMSVNQELLDDLVVPVEKPDSLKAEINTEMITLDDKSESNQVKEINKISCETQMAAKDVTDNNGMDLSEKFGEINCCKDSVVTTESDVKDTKMAETETASDHEIVVNENVQKEDNHEISECQSVDDDGLRHDSSNKDPETKMAETRELDKNSSVQTEEKMADCETETNSEIVESDQKYKDSIEHTHDKLNLIEQLNENVETDKIAAETDGIMKCEMDIDIENAESYALDTETGIVNTETEVGEDTSGLVIEAGAILKAVGETPDIKDEMESRDCGKGEHVAKHEDDVVWICFVCAKEFPDQNELMTHQDNCEDSADDQYFPMETDDTDIPVENIIDLQGGVGSQPHFIVTSSGLSKDTSYSEMTMPSKSPVVLEVPKASTDSNLIGSRAATSFPVLSGKLQAPVQVSDVTGAPVSSTSTKPVPTLLTKVGSQFKSLPLGLPLSRKRKRKRWPELYIPPPPEVYFNSLGLGPTPKVKEIEETPKKTGKDCDIIDLTVEESKPVTPRTPRSLMSQWSRDEASGRRRQLSFTQTPQPEKKAKKEEEDSSSDSDSSESSREERLPKRNVPCKSTIYAIPLTSPLGQRLKKHWQHENHVPVVSDIEQFCRTQLNASGSLSTKSRDVMDKLRNRPPPQITFRFTKKYLNRYHHSYKFNSADRREFQKKLKTGLEKESRRLLKMMQPCKVVLSRISKKDIKYWTSRAEKARNNLYLNQMQQHLRQKVVLEQQKAFRARFPTTTMLNNPRFIQLNNVQYRPVTPNIQFRPQSTGLARQTFPAQLRLISTHGQGPTPQLLVPHGAGVGNMLLVSASSPIVSQSQAVKRELTGSQKRKQDLSNVRVDDEISITILSSDEEEESCDKSPNCSCKDCLNKRKSAIRQKPRIGPASFKRKEALKSQQQYGNISGVSHYKLPVSAQRERLAAIMNNESAIGRSAQGGFAVNPSKSGEFMNFRMVNGQIQNLKMVNGAPVAQPNPVPHSPLILNKSIIKRPFIHSQSGSASPAPGSPVKQDPSSPIKGPCSPIRTVSGSHVHKDEDLGFEVIMIDSDEED